MGTAQLHRCDVLAAPWPGIHLTSTESARHFGRHWHTTYGLGLLEAGAHKSASGRGPVEAFAGDLVTTNPGEVHDGRPLGVDSRRWHTVYAEPDALQALLGRTEGPGEISQPVIQDPALARVLLQALHRLRTWPQAQADAAARLACEESLVHAFGLAFARHGTRRAEAPAQPALTRVHARLCDAPLQVPSLAELAQLAGLSKFQLLRRFRAVYGMTPFAWLQHQRAERARAWIAAGMDLARAAAAAGFADQSHMTRVFLRQFGFTPGTWRKATRLQ